MRARMSHELPAELRLGDLAVFFAVHRYGSVTGAARAIGTSPSHVSKAIARLEAQLGRVLVHRSVHGVALTETALRILPQLDEVVRRLHAIANLDAEAGRTLGFAAPSYLLTLFLPALAAAQPAVRFSGLELPPAMVRAQAGDNVFDLCLVVGAGKLPPAWQVTPIGPLRRALFARPALAAALGPPPLDARALAEVPFILPLSSAGGRFVEADDDCPLGWRERRVGHRAQTLGLALALAARTDQLVFGPAIAARALVDAGALVELPVRGWRSSDLLALACNPERVLASEHQALVPALTATLRALDDAPPVRARAELRLT